MGLYNTNDIYVQLLSELDANGMQMETRVGDAVVIYNHIMDFEVKDCMITLKDRKLSYNYMVAEALAMIRGDDTVAAVEKWAPNISRYSDDGVIFAGSYNKPFKESLQYIISMLRNDPETRQASFSCWKNNPEPSKNIPCMLSMTFYITPDGTLNADAILRSSDVWLGLPNDMFHQGMVTWYIAQELGIEPGVVNCYATNRHLYNVYNQKALDLVTNYYNKSYKETVYKTNHEWLYMISEDGIEKSLEYINRTQYKIVQEYE